MVSKREFCVNLMSYANKALLAGLLLLPGISIAEQRAWLPLDQQELKMTDFKPLPGADAVLLYYSNDIDDVDHTDFFYSRIKILTESGKRFATVEIPTVDKTTMQGFFARTVHPDGSVVEFEGQPFDKVTLKARGVRLKVKSFTLPQVTIGSIVEYRYELHYGDKGLRHHEWTVQHDLFVAKEHFRFRYDKHFGIRWLPSRGLEKSPDHDVKAGVLQMDGDNVAPFDAEDQMPPEDNYRQSMKFFYLSPFMSSPTAYWFEMGRWWSQAIDGFIGNHKEIKAAADEAIGSETDPEKKLHKLYARAQQIRNLSYERHRSQQEDKREELKEPKNIVDVLKHGYGDRNDIVLFFVGLARSEGFRASVVLVSSREERLFDREVLSFGQLNSDVANVQVNGKPVFLDPGTRFCPYGLLRWTRTGTAAMDMSDPGRLIATPGSTSEDAMISRSADMTLSGDGAVKGEVRVEFSGADALERRLAALDTDEAGRKKELEEEVKQWLPANSKADMTASTGWEDDHGAVTALFNVEVPEFASAAGKRLLVPLALFQPKVKWVLKNGPRRYPVYYHYAFTEKDHVSIKFPDGYAVESVASPEKATAGFASYATKSESKADRVNIDRSLLFNGIFFPPEQYDQVRSFFAKVQAGDDSQTVLRRNSTADAGKTN